MKFCVADSKQVLDAIERIYVAGEGTGQMMNDILGQLKSIALSDGDEESEANSAPIVRYIDLVLEQAMRNRPQIFILSHLKMNLKLDIA